MDADAGDKKWLASFRVRTNLRVNASAEMLQCKFGADDIFVANEDYKGGGAYFINLRIVLSAPDLERAHERAREVAEECTTQ
jgi:hypothetical protein